MTKVLFVCLGNICRSPMAEAVFNDMLKKADWRTELKPIRRGRGTGMSENRLMKAHGRCYLQKISCEGLYARQITDKDPEAFDYIIAMDAENAGHVRSLAGYGSKAVIRRLLDYVEDCETADVPDPYYTGNFDEVYELVAKGCSELLKDIRKEHKL